MDHRTPSTAKASRRHWIAAAALIAVAVHSGAAEIIDRIVAVVDHKHIVTASDIRQERAIRNALGEAAPEEREILRQLIDRTLVEEQMTQIPGLEVTDRELETELSGLRNPLAAGLPEVRAYVRARMKRARYEDRRFRQFIRVSAEEKEAYYRDVFLPEAFQAGLSPVPEMDDPEIDALIERNIVEEKVEREVSSAMEALYARSDVETFPN
jgi:hypothetical protein